MPYYQIIRFEIKLGTYEEKIPEKELRSDELYGIEGLLFVSLIKVTNQSIVFVICFKNEELAELKKEQVYAILDGWWEEVKISQDEVVNGKADWHYDIEDD